MAAQLSSSFIVTVGLEIIPHKEKLVDTSVANSTLPSPGHSIWNAYGLYGMGSGVHGTGDGVHGLDNGVHEMGDRFHGMHDGHSTGTPPPFHMDCSI